MGEWIAGMDLSSLAEVERCGGRFYDNGRQGDAMEILKRYGMNLVRLRLWNHPYAEDGTPYGGGGNDLATVLSLAARAKAKGIGWLLDLHYSDCWADPGKQVPPKAWQGLDLEGMEQAVCDYTRQVLARCSQENLLPQMVAVGNEVSNGLLWPYGKVPEYGNLARLISAGIRGVRSGGRDIPVMIHLDNGGNNGLYRRWFDQYLAHGGADFDYIGLSYYPFWHGTLADLQTNMEDLAVRYHKNMLVAEISTAHTLADYQEYERLPDACRKGMATKPEVAAQIPYAMTPEGQADFLRDIFRIIRGIPDGLGKGFCYWEPCWLPVPGSQWATSAAIAYMHEKGPGGNEWANQALFDYDGNALPGLEVIREFARKTE